MISVTDNHESNPGSNPPQTRFFFIFLFFFFRLIIRFQVKKKLVRLNADAIRFRVTMLLRLNGALFRLDQVSYVLGRLNWQQDNLPNWFC